MEKIQIILEFLTKYEPLLFLVYLLLSFITAIIIDKIFILGLKRIVSKSKTDIDDKLVETLHPAVYNTILYMGFYLAINTLTLPDKITFLLIGIIKSILVIYWSLGLFKSFIIIINWASNKDSKRALIKKKTLPLFDNLGKIIIFLFSIYFIMLSWGINVTAWIASAGILSVVIGFAAKDTLGNLFAGIFIMADSPYKEGDYINLDTGERGYVRDIGIRSTRIQTRDDIEITIPNSVIANSKIINESGGGAEKERLRINISVAYGTDIDKVREILVELSKSSENICKAPDPRVRFRSFGDSGLMFQLLFWIEKPKDRGRIIDEINSKIYKQFNAANIEIPFPQRTIHMQTSDIIKSSE